MNEIAMEKTITEETLKDICDEIQSLLMIARSNAQSISEALMGPSQKIENTPDVSQDCMLDQLNILRGRAKGLNDILMKIYGRIC